LGVHLAAGGGPRGSAPASRRIRIAAGALAGLALALGGAARGVADPPAPGCPSVEGAVLAAVNASRAAGGLPPLRPSPTLGQGARAQSAWLLASGRLTHDGPHGPRVGASPSDPEAENLAQLDVPAPDAAATAVTLWLASPLHRANMLSPAYGRAGVGVAGCGGEVLVVAVDLAGGPEPAPQRGERTSSARPGARAARARGRPVRARAAFRRASDARVRSGPVIARIRT
jgi:cysteine-rich secretory family protein